MKILAWFKRTRLGLDGLEIRLREDRPLRLTGARGRRLLCIEGCAWITAPGEPDDIYLRAGETWRVSSDGLVLVEGADAAAVTLAPQPRASRVRPPMA